MRPAGTVSILLVTLLSGLSCTSTSAKARAEGKQPKVMVFTGWGQSPTSLDSIVPKTWSITRIPYYENKSIAELTESIKERIKSSPGPDVVIGWSLGGRVSVVLVEKKILRPKLLVIIASGFRMKPGEGLDRITNNSPFYDLFETNPREARERLGIMIGNGDSKAKTVLEKLNPDSQHDKEWGAWLRNRFFSAETLDYSNFPNTLLVYGEKDHLIEKSHCDEYSRRIPKAEKLILADCGHAPHLHDTVSVSREIMKSWESAQK